ncbi:MAG: hypothetical protein IKO85_08335 [Bacteroidaceae bacterium]|nr:hypothetical protein [Prevotella sp.]MBR4534523.1 hypothetical protein [Bacteroidaceae bacterium]
MTADIGQHEAGALAFGRKTYGDDLADAMYLGTFGSIHYFGPVFYDFRISKNVESFLSPMTQENTTSCLLVSLNSIQRKIERTLSAGNAFGGT